MNHHIRRTSRRTLLASTAAIGFGMPAVHVRASGVDIPEGMVLVTSPRLPLRDVGPQDARQLLAGAIPNWRDLGCATDQAIQPIAVGQPPAGMAPVASAGDYEALVGAWRDYPGGVALVPADQVDFRANVLRVGGVDPMATDGAVRIGVVGDIVPGRNVDLKMREYGDFTYPFQKIAPTLSGFDVAIANMEGNLSSTIPAPTDPHTYTFVSDPKMVDGLKMAGIDAVSLGNNHSTWNNEGWGTAGLTDTMAALSSGGVSYFGAGYSLGEARSPFVTEAGGKRIAIIGIDGVTANRNDVPGIVYGSYYGGDGFYAGALADSPGTNPYDLDLVLPDIQALVAAYDIVIPYFHMGVEYVAVPPAWAIEGARAAIDAGATMVVTNHPHLIQGMEIYGGKPIVYSVGNFIFDQLFSVEVRQGYILDITIRDGAVVQLRMHGVEIEDFCQPRLMTDGEQASLMGRFWASSDRISGE